MSWERERTRILDIFGMHSCCYDTKLLASWRILERGAKIRDLHQINNFELVTWRLAECAHKAINLQLIQHRIKQGEPFTTVNYFAFMAIKAYLLHFSYKLSYFADIIKFCTHKKEQVDICSPLTVSLGYLWWNKWLSCSHCSFSLSENRV